MEINNKKKNLALEILIQGEEDDLNEKMTIITWNFRRFLRKKVGVIPSRRQEAEDRGKEIKRDAKIMEKKNYKDKVQCYKCKDYGYTMHEYPSKDK